MFESIPCVVRMTSSLIRSRRCRTLYSRLNYWISLMRLISGVGVVVTWIYVLLMVAVMISLSVCLRRLKCSLSSSVSVAWCESWGNTSLTLFPMSSNSSKDISIVVVLRSCFSLLFALWYDSLRCFSAIFRASWEFWIGVLCVVVWEDESTVFDEAVSLSGSGWIVGMLGVLAMAGRAC